MKVKRSYELKMARAKTPKQLDVKIRSLKKQITKLEKQKKKAVAAQKKKKTKKKPAKKKASKKRRVKKKRR